MKNTPHSWNLWARTACCFVAVALLLTGCASTPSTIKENGISRAMTEAERQTQDLVVQKAALADILAEDGRAIRTTLDGKNGTRLQIDAKVAVAPVERLTSFDLILTEPDSELAKSIFFANALELVTSKTLSGSIPGRQLWVVPTVKPRDAYDAYIATYDQIYNQEESYIGYNFNEDTVNPYKELTPIPVESFDEEHALETLKDILRRLSIPDLSPFNLDDYESTIWIAFMPQFTALPLVPPDGRAHYFGSEAYIDERGLYHLSISPYVQPGNITAIDALISVKQAIGIVEKNLGTALIPYLDKPIDEISLRHHYRYDQSTDRYRAHPVWYFHMQESPPRDVDFGISDDEQTHTSFTRYTSSFAVDAVSGLLCAVTEEEVWDDNDD
ncbi:MAG: hypothetical protein RR893_07320 [Clostridia bacterium]